MSRRLIAGASAATVLVALAAVPSFAAGEPAPAPAKPTRLSTGSFTLDGAKAAAFVVPKDMVKAYTQSSSDNGTVSRYQQMVGSASVFGGQITVLKDAKGTTTAVVGAYFPGLRAKNSVRLTQAAATTATASKLAANKAAGKTLKTATRLRLDPRSGKYFYQVDTIRANDRPVQWVDASSGAVLKSFNALAEGDGLGVKGDTKRISTTRQGPNSFVLVSSDLRQATYDAQNGEVLPGILMSDSDNRWNLTTPAFVSPDQRPGVDAHYYANVVDGFYDNVFHRDSIDGAGMQMISTVHFLPDYCNAFWNGLSMTYGDGDGTTCLPLSGGLDVVGHEFTHGVTEHTSGLIYQNESGALNESFSDIMANTMEFYAEARGLDPVVEPDWRIGEDVIPATQGFRNMGNPSEFNHPDHYTNRLIGTDDSGFVHSNSGIPNHAYYLAVHGGKNRGCAAVNPTHTADCDVTVPKVGLSHARRIFYDGFTSLPEFADMCDARNATVAVAGATRALKISAAWDAVGVYRGCTPPPPPPPPCTGSDNATLPFGTPNPYGNNADCTWVYDNGAAGFAFHFSTLQTEQNFDYVYVRDAGGNVLATYTGTVGATTSPCIPTATGSVQFTSDPSVVDVGFTVDSVTACTP